MTGSEGSAESFLTAITTASVRANRRTHRYTLT
jgi:hypothetical protein